MVRTTGLIFPCGVGQIASSTSLTRYAPFDSGPMTPLLSTSSGMRLYSAQSVSNGSFGIFFPKFLGTIYELLSAPVSAIETVIGYVGAAATKSVILGLIVLVTAGVFVPIRIDHPVWMIAFLVLTAITFSLVGFIIGIWAKGMEQLQFVPLLIITPLTFLGGTFYSISSSARARRDCGTVSPSAFAVLRFMISSNLSGCSTGRSAGLAPRNSFTASRDNCSP